MRAIDWFIPKNYHSDDDLLRRARLQVILLFILVGFSLLTVAHSLMMGVYLTAMANGLLAVLAIAFGLLLRSGFSFYVVIHAGMGTTFLNMLFGIYTTGGMGSDVLLWLTILPPIMMMLGGRAHALPWFAIVCGTVIGTYLLQRSGMEFANEIPEEDAMTMHLYILCEFAMILFLIVVSFDHVKNQLTEKLKREMAKSEELLLNILPYETAQELKENGLASARLMEDVTVLFTDFKGFTQLSETLSPKELVANLHECFSAFDLICEKYGIEKIKTIGDAYMAAGGLPTPCDDHAQRVVRAALEMSAFISERDGGRRTGDEGNAPLPSHVPRPSSLQMRIGIHTGPVVAGIVGIKKFQYDIWGDTVNTASRMESSGEVGKVNISETTYQLVKDRFACEYRGEVEAKGKGKLGMYFVIMEINQ